MNDFSFDGISVGFAVTASYCTFHSIFSPMETLVKKGAKVYPIFSDATLLDSRFMTAADFRDKVVEITGNTPITTIKDAEPIGPTAPYDILVVAPCTSNTIGKLVHGITDTPVTMACKAHVRNSRPLLLAISTNDALSLSAANIGTLLGRRHLYFVPFAQDNIIKKPRSCVANMELIPDSIAAALKGEQIQPILLGSQ